MLTPAALLDMTPVQDDVIRLVAAAEHALPGRQVGLEQAVTASIDLLAGLARTTPLGWHLLEEYVAVVRRAAVDLSCSNRSAALTVATQPLSMVAHGDPATLAVYRSGLHAAAARFDAVTLGSACC